MILDKLDTILRMVSKLDKRMVELEEINLSYLSIIDEINNSLGIFTGEVIKEVEEQQKSSDSLLSFPESKSSKPTGGNGGMKN